MSEAGPASTSSGSRRRANRPRRAIRPTTTTISLRASDCHRRAESRPIQEHEAASIESPWAVRRSRWRARWPRVRRRETAAARSRRRPPPAPPGRSDGHHRFPINVAQQYSHGGHDVGACDPDRRQTSCRRRWTPAIWPSGPGVCLRICGSVSGTSSGTRLTWVRPAGPRRNAHHEDRRPGRTGSSRDPLP